MPRTPPAVDHQDALKAVAFLIGIPADWVKGYAVIVWDVDGDWKITGNQTTKAAAAAYVADALAALTLEVASDLGDTLKS